MTETTVQPYGIEEGRAWELLGHLMSCGTPILTALRLTKTAVPALEEPLAKLLAAIKEGDDFHSGLKPYRAALFEDTIYRLHRAEESGDLPEELSVLGREIIGPRREIIATPTDAHFKSVDEILRAPRERINYLAQGEPKEQFTFGEIVDEAGKRTLADMLAKNDVRRTTQRPQDLVERALFFGSFAAYLDAGIFAVAALEDYNKWHAWQYLKPEMGARIREELAKGEDLASSTSRFQELTPVDVVMIKCGEVCGMLDVTLSRHSQYLDSQL